MKKYLLLLFCLTFNFISIDKIFADDKEERKNILSILEDICKRKDIDKIKKNISNTAVYITAPFKDTSNTNQFDFFINEIIKRDKDRALGKGSYEEIQNSQIVINDETAYVILNTLWNEKIKDSTGDNLSQKRTTSTIILEKKKKDWKIAQWQISQNIVNNPSIETIKCPEIIKPKYNDKILGFWESVDKSGLIIKVEQINGEDSYIGKIIELPENFKRVSYFGDILWQNIISINTNQWDGYSLSKSEGAFTTNIIVTSVKSKFLMVNENLLEIYRNNVTQKWIRKK